MSTKPKGGRGLTAPYLTRQVRVPEPVIEQVHELIEHYQSHIASGGNANHPPQLVAQKPVYSFSVELEEERKLVDKFKGRIASASIILKEALHLKANAGGAIKKEIEKALALLN